MIWIYRLGFAIDTIALLYVFYNCFEPFFSDKYRYTGSGNAYLWVIGFLLAGLLAAAYHLKNHQQMVNSATLLLWIPAVPLLLYAGLILLIVIGKPDFK